MTAQDRGAPDEGDRERRQSQPGRARVKLGPRPVGVEIKLSHHARKYKPVVALDVQAGVRSPAVLGRDREPFALQRLARLLHAIPSAAGGLKPPPGGFVGWKPKPIVPGCRKAPDQNPGTGEMVEQAGATPSSTFQVHVVQRRTRRAA